MIALGSWTTVPSLLPYPEARVLTTLRTHGLHPADREASSFLARAAVRRGRLAREGPRCPQIRVLPAADPTKGEFFHFDTAGFCLAIPMPCNRPDSASLRQTSFLPRSDVNPSRHTALHKVRHAAFVSASVAIAVH